MPAIETSLALPAQIGAYRAECRRRLEAAYAAERERRHPAGQRFHAGFWLSTGQLARLKATLTRRRVLAFLDFHLLLAVTGAVLFVTCKVFDIFFFP